MNRILIICLFLPIIYSLSAEEGLSRQEVVIKKEYILDYENIFTPGEVHHLDSIVTNCWRKGIAEIVIVTLHDSITTTENAELYVSRNFTAHALGRYGKNNGIVIVVSKKLGWMRILNGSSEDQLISNEVVHKIIEDQVLPQFGEGKYFEATVSALESLITFVQAVLHEEDFENASSIFRPSLFQDVRSFVLENGSPQTFRELDSDNPSYAFTSLDVFLGPSRKHAFVLKDFLYDDYYEMTIRNHDGSVYQFVYYEENVPEFLFIHEKMQPGNVYWWYPGDKFLSSDIWPLLVQIEDEITQKSAVNKAKPLTGYRWTLKKEFHPMERVYAATDHNDVLSFEGDHVLINGKKAGIFQMDPEDRIITLVLDEGQPPAFAIFRMEEKYYYRYVFDKEHQRLYLVPLDEREGQDLVCVEGCTLLFEGAEK